jgi:hypothetical protein
MSLRLEMIQAARRASHLLGSSVHLVHNFISSQQVAGGGFGNRAGNPDLYYTVFGLQLLQCLPGQGTSKFLADTWSFVDSFGDGETLDFVHLCCLARCHAVLVDLEARPRPSGLGERLWRGIEGFRAGDGGYHLVPGRARGTTYASFLAVGAAQDLHVPLSRSEDLLKSIGGLHVTTGGWLNERTDQERVGAAQQGLTNSTASAVIMLQAMGASVPVGTDRWLLAQAHPQGGFRAASSAPVPDVLSTATALHALSSLAVDLSPIRTACLDFLDTVWTNQGGFHGHWADDHLDCEYTFYGLLALGHLAER